jgi:hypothetical protein
MPGIFFLSSTRLGKNSVNFLCCCIRDIHAGGNMLLAGRFPQYAALPGVDPVRAANG